MHVRGGTQASLHLLGEKMKGSTLRSSLLTKRKKNRKRETKKREKCTQTQKRIHNEE
jgi:hypothetical protein